VPTAEVGLVTPSNPTLPSLIHKIKPPAKEPGKLVKENGQNTKVRSGKVDSRKRRQPKQPVAQNNQPPKDPVRVSSTDEHATTTNPLGPQTTEVTSEEHVPLTVVPETARMVPPTDINPVQLIRNSDFGSPNASDKMPDDWQQFHIGGVQTVTIKTRGDIPNANSGNVILLDGVEKKKYYPGVYQLVDYPSHVYTFEVLLRFMHYDDEDTKRIRTFTVMLDVIDSNGNVVANGLTRHVTPAPNGKDEDKWITETFEATFEQIKSQIDNGAYRLRIGVRTKSDFGRVTNGEGLYIDSVELWTKPR
jgi:hypothetical protein